jgi:RsiW-degrading membrane proteinase PrsW (M82 family)
MGCSALYIVLVLSNDTLAQCFFGFMAGMSASASVALLIERGSALLLARALHRQLFPMIMFDSYTTDPFVEEICKMLPLLLVLLIPRVRIRLGISDIVVICAALGSGFGFTESRGYDGDLRDEMIDVRRAQPTPIRSPAEGSWSVKSSLHKCLCGCYAKN